jgi:hypothetical protein
VYDTIVTVKALREVAGGPLRSLRELLGDAEHPEASSATRMKKLEWLSQRGTIVRAAHRSITEWFENYYRRSNNRDDTELLGYQEMFGKDKEKVTFVGETKEWRDQQAKMERDAAAGILWSFSEAMHGQVRDRVDKFLVDVPEPSYSELGYELERSVLLPDPNSVLLPLDVFAARVQTRQQQLQASAQFERLLAWAANRVVGWQLRHKYSGGTSAMEESRPARAQEPIPHWQSLTLKAVSFLPCSSLHARLCSCSL